MSALTVLNAPSLPLTAAEIRLHSRIDAADEDSLLEDYVAAAAEAVAAHIGRPVGVTQYRLSLDCFPCGDLLLPRPPAVSVDALDYTDSAGAAQSLDAASDVQVDLESEPARIRPLVDADWPETQTDAVSAVQVTFTAGRAVVSPAVLQAIRLLVGTWYEHRESVTERSLGELPDGVARLLAGQRFRSKRLNDFLSAH